MNDFEKEYWLHAIGSKRLRELFDAVTERAHKDAIDANEEIKQLRVAAVELYRKLLEIVSDFDEYGEVHQSDENDEYGEFSAIGRAKIALDKWEDLEKKRQIEIGRLSGHSTRLPA